MYYQLKTNVMMNYNVQIEISLLLIYNQETKLQKLVDSNYLFIQKMFKNKIIKSIKNIEKLNINKKIKTNYMGQNGNPY